MRLDDIRILTSKGFIEAVQNDIGPNALAVSYPSKCINELVAVAKHLIFLIAHNSHTPVTLEEIQSTTGRLGLWVRTHYLLAIAAYALALHNRGSKLRGATIFFNDTVRLRPYEIAATNQHMLSPYLFEYLWRGVLQFIIKERDLDSQDGPIAKFATDFKLTNLDQKACYTALNQECQLELLDKDKIESYIKKDRIFLLAYNS